MEHSYYSIDPQDMEYYGEESMEKKMQAKRKLAEKVEDTFSDIS
jgi:hypothetical protein